MEKDFSKNIVREYKYWIVYVHENQGYLGRCVIDCKRSDALHLTDTTDEEWSELRNILRDLQAATKKCIDPDWFNFAFLGNEWRHLHGHFVPRYATTKTFMGTKFEDSLYGHNFKVDHDFITTEEVLQSIKSQVIAALKIETATNENAVD